MLANVQSKQLTQSILVATIRLHIKQTCEVDDASTESKSENKSNWDFGSDIHTKIPYEENRYDGEYAIRNETYDSIKRNENNKFVPWDAGSRLQWIRG